MVGDNGYASEANRQAAKERGAIAIIPRKVNEKNKPARFARTIYRARAAVARGTKGLCCLLATLLPILLQVIYLILSKICGLTASLPCIATATKKQSMRSMRE